MWQVQELKCDALGRVERFHGPGGAVVRRVASGSGWPLSGWLARVLLRRERAALQALQGLDGVPQWLAPDDLPPGVEAVAVAAPAAAVLWRSWQAGVPLWQTGQLAVDYFERLRELVEAIHARGVCHNDLHKENNLLVGPDGWPAVVDFQLASRHALGSRSFRRRCAEDLRHIAKHAARYAAAGASVPLPPRPLVARWWRWLVKPVYNVLTRRLLGTGGRGEPRRPRLGPWPERTAALGARR